MLIKCLSFGAPTLTDQYLFDAQKRKTGMLPSQRAIANRFCGASEFRPKIGLHSIVRPKILLLELSDAESN